MLTQTDLEKIDEVLTKRIKTEIKPLRNDVKHIKKDLKVAISFFDNETIRLQKRINRIEDHLHLPQLS